MSRWLSASEEVLLSHEPAMAPPSAWTPQAVATFDWQPAILVVGRDLPRGDRARIEKTGVIERVETLQRGLQRMSDARWDVIVVAPELRDETDGLRFVRAFKVSQAIVGASDQLAALRERYRRTPFLVQPLVGDTQFAIFESASRWFLGNTWAVPLARRGRVVVRPAGVVGPSSRWRREREHQSLPKEHSLEEERDDRQGDQPRPQRRR